MNTSIKPLGPMIDWSVHIFPVWSLRVKSGTRSPTCGPNFDTSIFVRDVVCDVLGACATNAALNPAIANTILNTLIENLNRLSGGSKSQADFVTQH
jgi:hypothetical protein